MSAPAAPPLSPAFTPYRLLPGGHAQTLAGKFWPRRLRHRAELRAATTTLLQVEPGTQVTLRCNLRRGAPTVLLIHGLEGSADSGYILGTADKALSAGLGVARLNMRNCGGTEHLTPTLYHSGLTADVDAALRFLLEQGPDPIALCGFSMGGNLVLKLVGEYGTQAPVALRAVVAISAAADLGAAAALLERPENRVYQAFFLRGLAGRVRRKARRHPTRYDARHLTALRTVRQFDERYTAPSFGFRDAADYYEQASAALLLPKIRVPTLLIHAEDDPFVPLTPRVREAAGGNPHLRTLITPRGGHVGFLGRATADEDLFWAEHRAVDFLAATCGLAWP